MSYADAQAALAANQPAPAFQPTLGAAGRPLSDPVIPTPVVQDGSAPPVLPDSTGAPPLTEPVEIAGGQVIPTTVPRATTAGGPPRPLGSIEESGSNPTGDPYLGGPPPTLGQLTSAADAARRLDALKRAATTPSGPIVTTESGLAMVFGPKQGGVVSTTEHLPIATDPIDISPESVPGPAGAEVPISIAGIQTTEIPFDPNTSDVPSADGYPGTTRAQGGGGGVSTRGDAAGPSTSPPIEGAAAQAAVAAKTAGTEAGATNYVTLAAALFVAWLVIGRK